MTINNQALRMRNYLNTAVISGVKLLHLTTDELSVLLDELEASGKLIDTLRQDKDKVIDMSIERVNKLLSRAEAAEKRIAEHNLENRLLANADRDIKALRQRIAELEARTVKLPQYRNSPDMHTKQFYEAIGFNQGLDIFIEALRAAGIGVKGE